MTGLEKIQQLRELIQKQDNSADLNQAAKAMAEIIDADLYLLGKDGGILGGFNKAEGKNKSLQLNPDLQQRMAFIFQPTLNMPLGTNLFKDGKSGNGVVLTIYPLIIGGTRWGNLVLSRGNNKFSDEEIPVIEAATLVADILLSDVGSEKKDMESQMKGNAQVSLDSLSYSELEAIRNVFAELAGDEGFLVASKVADRIGITRSVIVNAMRKLESAGVVESRSLGMKGTYIRVKNPYFLSELANRRR
ncbi:MAG TPA: GTP-sensing pleiotropic transcriptional regulator CodY [Bacillota bacterium]|nr:GTP-sensing pleiotropic transcriptional regulator CodY [Bacillota bacterium]